MLFTSVIPKSFQISGTDRVIVFYPILSSSFTPYLLQGIQFKIFTQKYSISCNHGSLMLHLWFGNHCSELYQPWKMSMCFINNLITLPYTAAAFFYNSDSQPFCGGGSAEVWRFIVGSKKKRYYSFLNDKIFPSELMVSLAKFFVLLSVSWMEEVDCPSQVYYHVFKRRCFDQVRISLRFLLRVCLYPLWSAAH